MRPLFRISAVLFAFILGAFISVTLFVRFYGKSFVEEFFTASLDRKVEFSNIVYEFPKGMLIFSPRIAGILQAKQISFQFSIAELLSRKLTVQHLVIKEPMLLTREGKERTLALGKISLPFGYKNIGESSNGKKKFQIFIRKIDIYNAKCKFKFDLWEKEREVEVDQVKISLENVEVPFKSESIPVQIVMKVEPVSGIFKESSLRGIGSFNPVTKNLNGQMVLKEIEKAAWLESEVSIKDRIVNVKGKITKKDMFVNLVGVKREKGSFLAPLNFKGDLVFRSEFEFQTNIDDFAIKDVLFNVKLEAGS
ncbi:MAG: hypothetical protein HQL25_00245 [Candidatus Omnitrophica bacterium]|nr:hypothetical protein [Candidatus Omnitrophota bacterium]